MAKNKFAAGLNNDINILMQKSIVLFFLLAFSSLAMGQIIEVPPFSNPTLVGLQNSNDRSEKKQRFAHIDAETVFVSSGNTITYCLDTSTLPGAFGTLLDLNCETVNFGTLTIDDNCFTYVGNSGVTQGRDTICLQFCDVDNNCDTYDFPIEVRESLILPFFDDFSTSVIYPNELKWQDRDVYVNNNLAIGPPSVGVATFDGLDTSGRPYGTGSGISDNLTSAFLDLSSFSSNDDVYLSFFIQPKGFGDRPEEKDSLILEFKNSNNDWISIDQYAGFESTIPSDSIADFTFKNYHLDNTDFLHSAFQFRFRNYSNNSGYIDLWHLDYVRVIANFEPSPNFDDVAFTSQPKSILKNYSSMPWNHFIGFPDELNDTYELKLFNHFETPLTTQSSAYRIVENVTGGIPLLVNPMLDASQNQNVIANGETVSYQNIIPDFSSFSSAMQNNYTDQDSLVFESIYSFSRNSEEGDVTNNNEVKRKTFIHNYFAYDDGNAETNIIAQNRGTEIAVKFRSNVPDTLFAIAIQLPEIIDQSSLSQLFNIRIYLGQLDDSPEFEAILQEPFFATTVFDTLNALTTYALMDFTGLETPVPVPAGDFYIGIQTASDTPVAIGLDKNSPEAASNNFVGISGGWVNFVPTLDGAVMLRPVFAKVKSTSSTVSNPVKPLNEIFKIYPNPSRGTLHFNTIENQLHDQYDISIFSTLGQQVFRSNLEPIVDLTALTNGIYFIQVAHKGSGAIYQDKIVIEQD